MTEPTASPVTPGDILDRRYRIVRFIQAGGMGAVYEAEDLQGGGRVALKTIRQNRAWDPNAVVRFKREVTVAKQVTHPNVCRIYDLHVHVPAEPETSQNVLFLTMELLAGKTLREYIDEHGPVDQTSALPLIEEMAAGLDAAHKQGVVHRDFKPGNVFLVATRNPAKPLKAVVTDFGLARSAVTEGETFTEPGVVLGTPDYMAPEQLEGERATSRSDVYSLGLVVYEMLVGESPRRRAGMVTSASAAILKSRAPGWKKAILQCLAPNPVDRFASTAEFVEALRNYSQNRAARAFKHVSRGALSAVVLLTLLAAMFWYARRPPGPAPNSHRPSIAVMGFHDVSPVRSAEDLSPALEQGIGSALRFGAELYVVPGETVARVRRDLSLGNETDLSANTLSRIRKITGADFVLCGSYIAAPSSGEGVDLYISLQDARLGDSIASMDEQGNKSKLVELAYLAGVDVRKKLHVAPEISPEAMRVSMPSNPEALRLFTEGMDDLHAFQYRQASRLLEEAVRADPNFGPAHSALAEIWTHLGSEAKAKEEIEKALRLSGNLNREEQLVIEARYWAMSRNDWEKAQQIYRDLLKKYPDNLDYGLDLVGVQGGKEQLETVAQLRRLPSPMRDDPRIDLAEAECDALSDYRTMQSLAARAAEKATAIGARQLEAEARSTEAYAWTLLDGSQKALSAYDQARTIYTALGNDAGVANTTRGMARVMYSQGQLSNALTLAQQTLITFTNLGADESRGRTMNLIGSILTDMGRIEQARRSYQDGLSIFEDLNSAAMVATLKLNLGEALLEKTDTAGARRNFEEAVRFFRSNGNDYGAADALNALSALLVEQGDLAGARSTSEEALTFARRSAVASEIAHAQFALAGIAWEQAQPGSARSLFDQAFQPLLQSGDQPEIASARLARAGWELEEASPRNAQELAEQAEPELRREARIPDLALSKAMEASALLANGKRAEACSAFREANRLLRATDDELARLSAVARLANVEAHCGLPVEAKHELEAAIRRASSAKLLRLELEARLALAQIELESGRRTAAHEQFELVQRQATAHGYLRLARRSAKWMGSA